MIPKKGEYILVLSFVQCLILLYNGSIFIVKIYLYIGLYKCTSIYKCILETNNKNCIMWNERKWMYETESEFFIQWKLQVI